MLGLSGGIDSARHRRLAVDGARARHVHRRRDADAVFLAGQSWTTRRRWRGISASRTASFPIDAIFQAHLDALAPGRSRAARPDTTEENIQARVRGAVLMALSNKFGSLLLTTGNKSELAVGYCTLYGDMCGGLAVISDVPKTLVYRIARYINRDCATSSRRRR